MRTLSVAFVGAGNIAGGFDENRQPGETGVYTHAGAFRAHGGFDLKAVFDLDATRAERFCQAWGVGSAAPSLEHILAHRHDVVSICTPDETHYGYLKAVLEAGCCRTVFVEKPLALETPEIETILDLTQRSGIHVVVNFQRRYETVHQQLRERIQARPQNLVSASCHYMKGLRHIGVTMIDTLTDLCGYPDAVLSFNRVFNAGVDEFSYEFVLFYPGFTATVKTTDAERFSYNYHLFEIDLLLSDGRAALVDISQGLRESPVTQYAYSGVKILNERAARYRETEYKRSMLAAAKYIHEVTGGQVEHRINRPEASFNNALIADRIVESFDAGMAKLPFDSRLWKK